MLDKLLGLLKSKTFYVNIAMAVVGVITEGLATVGLDPAIYAAIVAGVNFVLRWVTKESLEAKVA